MKISKVLLISLCVFLITSCSVDKEQSYTEKTVDEFNGMVSPVVLISKHESFGMYGVSLIDSAGVVHNFGNMSTFANGLGDSYKIGDTIK